MPPRPVRYATLDDIKDFRTTSQIIDIVRPVIREELKAQDDKFSAHRAEVVEKLNDVARGNAEQMKRINEMYANGSGGPKGFLERMEQKQDLRWQQWVETQADTQQKLMNFMYRNEQEAEKAAMRAEVVKEIADERAHTMRKIFFWVKTAAGLAGSSIIWELGRAVWHVYHPIAAHIVSGGTL